ncbi:MAG: DUF4465 domain-containing protein [Planctomycetota bacterium]
MFTVSISRRCGAIFFLAMWLGFGGLVARAETITTVDFESFPLTFDEFDTVRGPFPDNQFEDFPFGPMFPQVNSTITIDGLTLDNRRIAAFDSFSGFAASRRTLDLWSNGNINNNFSTDDFEFGNDTISVTGTGADASATWMVAFGSGELALEAGSTFQTLSLNNTQTTSSVIVNGNAFSSAFGSRPQDELFTVTFTDLTRGAAGGEVVVDLASYDLATDTLELISDWQEIDLSSLDSNRIGISFNSTDFDSNGLLTPTYVAIDNVSFSTIPEPATWATLGLAASAIAWRNRRRRSKP